MYKYNGFLKGTDRKACDLLYTFVKENNTNK